MKRRDKIKAGIVILLILLLTLLKIGIDSIRDTAFKKNEGKVDDVIREIADKDCTGRMNLNIVLKETLTDNQLKKIKQFAEDDKFSYYREDNLVSIDVDVDGMKQIASLDFVRKIEPRSAFSVCGPGDSYCGDSPFAEVTCKGKKWKHE